MPNGNGDADSGNVLIDAIDDDQGWVYFSPVSAVASDARTAKLLGQTVGQWIRKNPEKEVISTLGVVRAGRTEGIHLWYRLSGAE